MRVKIWGARGSIPAPGPETMRYGGNTSCVELTLSDGTPLVLDAGTGIRNLGLAMDGFSGPLTILLTHLHLDHIQGLMFFNPAVRHKADVTVWGPPSEGASLCDRIARYISAPLAPLDVRELPFTFREAVSLEWKVGCATVRAQPVNHRGPTLGYRIEDGDTSICYIPDHEPGVAPEFATLAEDWLPALELARDASLLIHDCQYTDDEYPDHIGWGHCPLTDALEFARRARARQVLLFHHDPMHSDAFLDDFDLRVKTKWCELGGSADDIELATERHERIVSAGPAQVAPARHAAAAS